MQRTIREYTINYAEVEKFNGSIAVTEKSVTVRVGVGKNSHNEALKEARKIVGKKFEELDSTYIDLTYIMDDDFFFANATLKE